MVETYQPPYDDGSPIQLAPGLWQVAGPGITHPWDGGAYLVTGGARPALIDCGTGLGDLDAAILACGAESHDLMIVIATHGHFDHVGDGARLAALGIPVLVHPGDAESVRSGDPIRTCAQPLYGSEFEAFEPQLCSDGQIIDLGNSVTLEILHTPGHTPGSICVIINLAGRRILVAGDILWGGFSVSVGSDEMAWRASLTRLAALKIDAFTFGHAPLYLMDQFPARIAEAQAQFAVYLNPWYRPPRLRFRYL